MVERLPKNCSIVIDHLEKALGSNLVLGVKVECGKLGNKFKLVAAANYGRFNQTSHYVKVSHDVIIVPGLKKLVDEVWPDFLLKPASFMSIECLTTKFKLDKEKISIEILKSIRSRMKKLLNCYYHPTAVSIYVEPFIAENPRLPIIAEKPSFTSFTEFLIWVDLNAQ